MGKGAPCKVQEECAGWCGVRCLVHKRSNQTDAVRCDFWRKGEGLIPRIHTRGDKSEVRGLKSYHHGSQSAGKQSVHSLIDDTCGRIDDSDWSETSKSRRDTL